MNKHTPGPWRVGCQHGLQKLEIANSNYSKAVATVWAKQAVSRREDGRQVYVADPEGEANCRLIAAAPEMEEAIIDADGCFEAALCEGWLEVLADGDIDRIRDLWERRLSHARNLFPAAIAKATGAP